MRGLFFLVAVAVAGCARPPAQPDAFAIAAIDAARAGSLPATWLDDALADQLRRVQLWKRVPVEHASPSLLAALYARDPESALPFAERAKLHRRRAAENLGAALGGPCVAGRDDELLRERVDRLTAPVANAPAAANAELAALAARLAHAVVVRVDCERGAVGVTLVPDHPWRIVDLFAPSSAELTPLPLATR